MISHSKLEKKIKLSDKARNFGWIKRQYDKGRLTLTGYALTAPIFEQFREAVKTTEEIYEGNWDFDFQVSYSKVKEKTKVKIDIRGIILHFPEIKITNSYQREHTIVDLFIRIGISLRGSNLYINDTQGARTKVSYAEWSSQYIHSHLHRKQQNSEDQVPYWDSFCTGSGHINEAIAEINSDGFTIQKFTAYLLNLHTLVSWESLEGGPYMKITDIMSRSSSARTYIPDTRLGKELSLLIINKHKVDKITPALNFTIENGQYIIKDDETFEKFLTSVPFTDSQKDKYLCTKTEQGVYHRLGGDSQYRSVPRFTKEFIFQGISRKFEVYGIPGQEEGCATHYVHPVIKQHIKNELEYDCNKKSVRKSTIDRYTDQVSDVRENTKPSKISM